jgi:3-keto-disaccharide hydrolase
MPFSSKTSRRRGAQATLCVVVWSTTGALSLGACSRSASTGPTAQAPAPQSVSVARSAGGWRTLFNGSSLAAWRGYQSPTVPDGWKIVSGTLAKEATTGDILTKDEFGDFELEFEWKIGKGGNSGVFYRGTEEYEHIYWSAPEYQLLDDANAADGKNRLTSAGAAYALYAPPAGIVKAADEWNASRIVVRGAHVEHWMNGKKLLEYELWSPDWEAKVKESKFGAWPNYGRAKRGYIGIQGDHNGGLAFRNIRIRELK